MLENHLKIKKIVVSNIFITSFFCFFISVAIYFSTIWQGSYNLDPHHWGLMLSNAKDLYEGKLPYKEIFIQYGFLTTIIQSIAFSLFGTLEAIISITSLAYIIGIVLIYFITFELTKNLKLSVYSLISCFLVHPIVIYPWANYIAFPFIALGIFLCIKNSKNAIYLFFSGLSFGMAFLSREGLLPTILFIFISSALIEAMNSDVNKISTFGFNFGSMFFGFLLPILIFLIYLSHYDLLFYWYKLSWQLPKIYIFEMFPDVSKFGGFYALFSLCKFMIQSTLKFDFRWIIFSLITLLNLIIIFSFTLKKNFYFLRVELIKISFWSLALLTSSLHLFEIFRLATGSIIGIIVFFVFFEHYKKADLIFLVLSISLVFSSGKSDSGNYFFPDKSIIETAKYVDSPSFFKGQKWKPEVSTYYENIDNDLKRIKSSCNIKFQYNGTLDAFLQVLSPFAQYQIAPFFTIKSFDALRSDLNFTEKIKKADDLIVLEAVSKEDFRKYKSHTGYFVYKSYEMPNEHFIEPGLLLLINVPKHCEILS